MNQDEQNYKKALIFKIGIIVIIVVIFFLWLANLRNVLEDNQEGNNQTWKKITEDIDNSLNRLDDISNDLASTSTENKFVDGLVNLASSTIAATTTSTSTVKIELKEELKDLIKQATTTKSNCPEYINCMPSIGEARPCIIPTGCENITQIAY